MEDNNNNIEEKNNNKNSSSSSSSSDDEIVTNIYIDLSGLSDLSFCKRFFFSLFLQKIRPNFEF